ncbi:hypothetical protein G3I76_45520, partial [Streptomyces sp. SID11233]|nr:hypothetical protein [Streptomyces sp. SID11233]
AFLLIGPAIEPANAAHPPWNQKTKCEAKDPDGRRIPTRYGNSHLGWNHLSGKHNVKKCAFITSALNGDVDEEHGPRLVYYGNAVRPGKKVIKTRVIVQYARQTNEKKKEDRYTVK